MESVTKPKLPASRFKHRFEMVFCASFPTFAFAGAVAGFYGSRGEPWDERREMIAQGAAIGVLWPAVAITYGLTTLEEKFID